MSPWPQLACIANGFRADLLPLRGEGGSHRVFFAAHGDVGALPRFNVLFVIRAQTLHCLLCSVQTKTQPFPKRSCAIEDGPSNRIAAHMNLKVSDNLGFGFPPPPSFMVQSESLSEKVLD